MQNKKIISTLVICIAVFAVFASIGGIFSTGGDGPYEYRSIRGEDISIYGHGLYEHMSADVAIQGIAQDYVTLCMAVPALLLALYAARKSSLKARLFLAGVLNYFFVTYLFYLSMAMYNEFFLVYVVLTGTSFFALALTLISIDISTLPQAFGDNTPVKFAGGFLIFTASSIALLWLSVVVPPLLDGTIIPRETDHYTTLIVQGFDLSLLHPIAFISGLLLIKKNAYGYLMAPVTTIFLVFLMTALIAKIIAMALEGVNVVPAVFIIPCIALAAVASGIMLFRNIKEDFLSA